ncbi:hypothetical protein ACJJTC_017168 [Scirpophaga incertulas]
MFFDQAEEIFLNPDLFQFIQRDLSNVDIVPCNLRDAPTHTEDGIPIRKLYVSNLPPKTTRAELFNIFAQYGFIKSCWLRMGDRGIQRTPMATYAFVTYSNPEDAHKALQAPIHEKVLRGRTLRTFPADSWHQPSEDANGRVIWRPHGSRRMDLHNSHHSSDPQGSSAVSLMNGDANEDNSSSFADDPNIERSYNILDILNSDCLMHILQFVSIKDLIRSERVSKSWQNMVQEYFISIRTFKTSWWGNEPGKLTTAVLRRVLQRLGPALLRLHIDHSMSTLNDRTAHIVGKFCPNLEELKVHGMFTRNWNPLHYGCKHLKTVYFDSCNKLTDASLVPLVKYDSSIEVLRVSSNTHVTGLFLTEARTSNIQSLSFYNCYSLQGTVLCAAMDTMPNLTILRLDVYPLSMWKLVPRILKKLPRLTELSLSEYQSIDTDLVTHTNEHFCQSLSLLTELKTLNLSRNIFIDDDVLKQVGQSCTKLESLNVSSCNARRTYTKFGVSDEGLRAVCSGCRALRSLDVSYLAGLAEAGMRAIAQLPQLGSLTAQGTGALDAAQLARCLRCVHTLQFINVCGCENVSEVLVEAALEVLVERPRPITLWLGGTAASHTTEDVQIKECPQKKLLTVDLEHDRSNPTLRPDLADHLVYESDDSDDIYEHLYDDMDEIDVDGKRK